MISSKYQNFFNQKIETLKGVGIKTKKLLERKKIEKISDLLLTLPQGFTDRTNLQKLNSLEIGKITTIKVKVIKYNFPRIRNLPNKINCEDEKGKIDIVFFNSKEGYIKKILPINSWVVISGKINYFKNKYQITNPAYIAPLNKEYYIKKKIPKYSLTEGLSEKIYRKLIEQVLEKIPNLDEWHSLEILKKFGNKSLKDSLIELHNPESQKKLNSDSYKRLAFDEIFANLLVLSQVRRKINKIKKEKKIFNELISNKITKKFNFKLTINQEEIINQINSDLKSKNKMFRLLQGDVGSGKTIISFIAAANVIESNFQAAFMAPTEILAAQHYNLAKNIFANTDVKIELITGSTKSFKKKYIFEMLANGKIDLLIGTHTLFQKKILFNNLGLAIIDEQHKFGVKQRIDFSNKGGINCDIILMSATPIPRTLILTHYGDMDISKLIEKPKNRKEIITLSKPEEKIDEILFFLKKQISSGNQIFWVCPLIQESEKKDYSAAIKTHEFLSKKFSKNIGLIHGSLNKHDKEKILKKFLNKSIDILVSTTVIEVGIDFPNANIIVIQNSNKFGLSQLHQLRGRVGRGVKQGTCILLYKKNLSQNAKKRIKILKSTNDGFIIAEEDLKIRGFGDILGYQQSGIKDFKLADPIFHKELFELANIKIKKIQSNNENIDKFIPLIKFFDKSNIINEINS